MKEYNFSNSDLSNLLILEIQERERVRISQDFHDITLQNLVNLMHNVEFCQMLLQKDLVSANLEMTSVKNKLKNIIEDARNIIFNLRQMSFDDLGFEETLKNVVIKLTAETGIKIDIDIVDVPEVFKENDSIILVTLYRIIYECLMNAVNHSQGEEIIIKMFSNKSKYNIEIKDNGKGFVVDDISNRSNKHFGLSIMEERIRLLGGKLNINSKIDKGTSINIEIDID